MNIKEEVQAWLEDYAEEEKAGALSDLQAYGCISGMVTGLIYTEDTLAFYKKHEQEISTMLVELDIPPSALNGFDEDDPLCLETNNKNLLAWFGFEQGAGDVTR